MRFFSVGPTCLWPQGLALAWSLGFLPALCAGRGLVRYPAAVFPDFSLLLILTLCRVLYGMHGENMASKVGYGSFVRAALPAVVFDAPPLH